MGNLSEVAIFFLAAFTPSAQPHLPFEKLSVIKSLPAVAQYPQKLDLLVKNKKPVSEWVNQIRVGTPRSLAALRAKEHSLF
jgi:hypothetical protein